MTVWIYRYREPYKLLLSLTNFYSLFSLIFLLSMCKHTHISSVLLLICAEGEESRADMDGEE